MPHYPLQLHSCPPHPASSRASPRAPPPLLLPPLRPTGCPGLHPHLQHTASGHPSAIRLTLSTSFMRMNAHTMDSSTSGRGDQGEARAFFRGRSMVARRTGQHQGKRGGMHAFAAPYIFCPGSWNLARERCTPAISAWTHGREHAVVRPPPRFGPLLLASLGVGGAGQAQHSCMQWSGTPPSHALGHYCYSHPSGSAAIFSLRNLSLGRLLSEK